MSARDFTAVATGLAALIVAIGGVGAAWVAVNEYRLKSAAQRVETDVKLSQLLAELVPIANGRGKTDLSENAATAIVRETLAKGDPSSEEISEALEGAVVSAPVGAATQAVAITTIGYLGATHETLREPSRQALQALGYVDDKSDLEASRRFALELLKAGKD